MARRLLLGSAIISATFGKVASLSTAIVPQSSGDIIFGGLQRTPLYQASSQELVALPSLWRSNTPFGIGDETAVVAFLRHFG